MLGTSSSNIEKILIQNRCGSLADINKKDIVYLELYHLSGYLDLSEFTQGAVELRIINSVPKDPKWGIQYNLPSVQEKELEIANKKKDLITLDARNAGDFAYWTTDKCGNYHFIEKIILRHPNQVFSFGIGPGFSTSNRNLNKLFQMAQIKSCYTNINKHRHDKTFVKFKKQLDNINRNFEELIATNADIDALVEKIKAMQENIKYLKEVKAAGYKEKIAVQIKEISNINKTNQNKIQIQDIQVLDPEFFDGNGGEQLSRFQHLPTSAIESLKIRNREFYAKQR